MNPVLASLDGRMYVRCSACLGLIPDCIIGWYNIGGGGGLGL